MNYTNPVPLVSCSQFGIGCQLRHTESISTTNPSICNTTLLATSHTGLQWQTGAREVTIWATEQVGVGNQVLFFPPMPPLLPALVQWLPQQRVSYRCILPWSVSVREHSTQNVFPSAFRGFSSCLFPLHIHAPLTGSFESKYTMLIIHQEPTMPISDVKSATISYYSNILSLILRGYPQRVFFKNM
jgi:hypothetical protein